ncbi:general substrate transporter [Lentinus brumalis]|uniref:General substrate transporter n=1 Tax=Lentinus brumalis TaxID=2498619 RepID=A0A371CJS8_9APHY|nr:general substrate transporter [Polyporus brumalis]
MGVGGVATTSTSPVVEGYRHLLDGKRKWYNNRRLIALDGWIVLCLLTSSYNGFDGSLINSLQSMDTWEDYFNRPQGSLLGLLNAIQNIGSIAAFPFAPYLSDGIGRRPTIIMGAVIVLIGAALQTASHSIGMFVGARFMIGFGVSWAHNASPMLVTELSYPPYRAPLTSLYNSLWASGAIIAAWTTFGTEFMHNSSWSWRIPSLVQAAPAVFQVTLLWFAPESPRYLVAKGREAEALATLAYYHADGDESDPLVQYEIEEIKAAISIDRAATSNIGWKSLFTSLGNRRRLRVVLAIAWFSQWSGNGLTSYYLNIILNNIGITSSTIKLLINAVLQIWSLAFGMSASFLVERIGRRPLFISSCAGMLVFFTMLTVCSAVYAENQSQAAAHAVIAFIALHGAAYSLAFTPLLISYTVEILPYSVRAKGLTLLNFTTSCALVFNQYVNPIALKRMQWRYYIVYCCWLVFELVYCWIFVVETKGLSLEETAALFDGTEDQVVAQGLQAAGALSSETRSEKEKDMD